MKQKAQIPIPAFRALNKLGQDIKDARRRRRIPTTLMAERTGLSKGTILKIEKGDPGTSIGNYTNVLFVLGMLDRLSDLADGQHDLPGRHLANERLPQRIYLPRQDSTEEGK